MAIEAGGLFKIGVHVVAVAGGENFGGWLQQLLKVTARGALYTRIRNFLTLSCAERISYLIILGFSIVLKIFILLF